MLGLVRVGLLALLGAMLAWFVVSGQAYLYVNERSVYLVALCVPLLAAMALAHLRHLPHSGDRLGVALLALPLVVGLLFPAHPLGSAALDNQAPTTPVAASGMSAISAEPLQVATGSLVWDLRQLSSLQMQDPEMRGLDGQHASLLGFVYRTPGLPEDEFLAERFVVRCCTADAVAVSIPVHYVQAANLARDTWVQVEGTIHYAGPAGDQMPIVEAEKVEVVPEPARPYIYP